MSITAIAIKTAATLLKNEKARTFAGTVIIAVCLPVILIFLLVAGILSGASNHNHAAVDYVFGVKTMSEKVSSEYAAELERMKKSFEEIDKQTEKINKILDEGSLDLVRVEAFFYAVFFGNNADDDSERAEEFVGCFITTEQRKKGGKTYEVKAPQNDMNKVKEEIENVFEMQIENEKISDAEKIYSYVKSQTEV